METYINAYIHICCVKSLKFVVVEADGHVTRSEVTFGSNLKDFCGFFPRRNLTPLLFVDHYFWLLITIFLACFYSEFTSSFFRVSLYLKFVFQDLFLPRRDILMLCRFNLIPI